MSDVRLTIFDEEMDSSASTSRNMLRSGHTMEELCRGPRPRRAKAHLKVNDILKIMEDSDRSDISSDEESVELYQESEEDHSERDCNEEGEEIISVDTEASPVLMDTISTKTNKTNRKCNTDKYIWKKKDYPVEEVTFEDTFKDIPLEPLTPRQYFKTFITAEMLEEISKQTNLYGFQKTGLSISTTPQELEKLLGMYFRMGLIQMPRTRAYWETSTRCGLVADVMSRNRFEKLIRFLHFVDNSSEENTERSRRTKERPNPKNKDTPQAVMNSDEPIGSAQSTLEDRCWRLRPFLSSVRTNLLKIEEESKCSVDEVLIPFRGRSYLKQYIRNKPHCRWGLKLWARAGESGILYDFDIYEGRQAGHYGEQLGYRYGLGAGITIQLSSTMNTESNRLLVTDNYFTGLELVNELSKKGIHFVGTVNEKRLKQCKLKSEKEMKAIGRGAIDFRVTTTSDGKDLIALKWFDNRQCVLLSNFVGVEPKTVVQRWDKKKKEKIVVECPSIIPAYNRSMGGVDLLDYLTFMYKYELRSNRWYMYIFWHLIQVCAVNSWLLYRRHAKIAGIVPARLRIFLADLATSLILADKKHVGRPSLENKPFVPKKHSKQVTPRDVRLDSVSHWPVWNTKRNRCAVCKNQNSYVSCEKCRVYLCLNKERNCFKKFHM